MMEQRMTSDQGWGNGRPDRDVDPQQPPESERDPSETNIDPTDRKHEQEVPSEQERDDPPAAQLRRDVRPLTN
jgi:hypothetical protein